MKFTRRWGFIALAVFLILYGLGALIGLPAIVGTIAAIAAIAAGVLLLIDR